MTSGASATSRLRLVGYAAILTALAFSQAPGRIVADSKFDLSEDPWGFLARSLHLWDPQAAFGQVQNQAAGYLWPMGPFFGLGHSAGLPDWVVQRLWWALLLNVAFFGVLLLLRELRVGRPWAQVAAAAAYVLAPRMTSILGATSVELWPTAVAPWVLVPLVRGSRQGSVLKAAALSALAVATCGGVNATAVSAVLPMGVLWILTRSSGPRRWRLLVAWTGLTALATLWWLVPLWLQGRYAAPFLDYIETSALTQSVTGLADSVLGTSDWAPYLSPGTYPAGATILSTHFMLWDAAAIAALGVLGLVRHPHRRFLVLSLLTGLVLVGLGYTGDVHGWWAHQRQDLLDGVLSPLRNSHKYDVIVRLSLVVGLAHLLEGLRVPSVDATLLRQRAGRVLTVTAVVALCGLALPWAQGRIPSGGAFSAVPDYWREVARYLDRPGSGTALVMPAAAFGDYTWGSTHDDVLQPLARSRWASRNVIPLAEPGNVRLLDEITSRLEDGRGSPELAPMLAAAGVDRLVVRNDLDRLGTGAPDPTYVRAGLADSPGLSLAEGFGPVMGGEQHFRADDGTRVVRDVALSSPYRAVEVYDVDGAADARLLPTDRSMMGDPGSGLPLTGDLPAEDRRGGVVLTDGMRARDEAFSAVRGQESETQSAGAAGTLSQRRILPDQERWETTATWAGVDGVAVSSSRAAPGADAPIDRGSGAAAALDGDPSTAWRSAGTPDGQWLQVDLAGPTDIHDLRLSVPAGAGLVGTLEVRLDARRLLLPAPAPGTSATWRIDQDDVRQLRITARTSPTVTGWWGISELEIPGVHAQRVLRLPAPPQGAVVDEVRLTRDAGARRCPTVGEVVACLPFPTDAGEDGARLDRLVTLGAPGTYDVRATASLLRDPALSRPLTRELGVGLRATRTQARDLVESALAMIDGDPATSWRGSLGSVIRLTLPTVTTVNSLDLGVSEAAPVSAPSRVRVSAPDGRAVERTVDDTGRVEIPGWRTDRIAVKVLDVREAFSIGGGGDQVLPPGISQLLVNGRSVVSPQLPDTCGLGPDVVVGGRRIATAMESSLGRAVRGESVPLRLCGAATATLPRGPVRITAEAGRVAQPDTLTFLREGVARPATTQVEVRRDGRAAPVAATMPARDTASVLALPQNFNDAWTATLDGRPLHPQRVDGWQQGWLVPAGAAGTVRFEVAADRIYRTGLAVGLGGLLATVLVLVLVAVRRRGSDLPPLADGRSRVLDLLVVVGALGLLGGWPGVGVAIAVAFVTARLRVEPVVLQLAAGVTMLAATYRVWEADWLDWVAQGATLSACALVAGSLLANGPLSLRRSTGRSRHR